MHAISVVCCVHCAHMYSLFIGIDICRLQPESGLCLAYFPSYFYNSTSRMCEMFVYGGCGGNENRFSTIEDCQAACGRSKYCHLLNMFLHICYAILCMSINYLACVLLLGVNVCELDPETGPCEANFPSFFYNATSQRCERFVYGGCQGNGNRFSTTTECQKACGELYKLTRIAKLHTCLQWLLEIIHTYDSV